MNPRAGRAGHQTDALLEVDRVCVRFCGLRALEAVSFGVPRGSIVGVIGPTGSGKTTLFDVICGFTRPTVGSLFLDGSPFEPSPGKLASEGIARTLQGVGLFQRMTVLDNVVVSAGTAERSRCGPTLLGSSTDASGERRRHDVAMHWLERVGMADRAHVAAGALPFPEQQRVGLARALASSPRLLLLDEPGDGFAPDELESLEELIRSLGEDREHPMSVLLIERHLDLVMRLCHQVVVLDVGGCNATG